MTTHQVNHSIAASVSKPSSVASHEARLVIAPRAYRSFWERASILPRQA